jgi:arginase family enzyme
VIGLLQNIEGEVVGADLVEYNPRQDVGGLTAIAGAKLMKELLGRLIQSP